MIGEKMDSQKILNRLMSAYGVASQKALAEKLGIPANNISGWIQRDSVPGNPIIKCALDTETDLRWLVSGEFANANLSRDQVSYAEPFSDWPSTDSGQELIKKMLSTGGRPVLQRIMDAYKFNTQKELSEYLGISTGTISTWVRRGYFPADVVIACSLSTGVPLQWLAIGANDNISHKKIINNSNMGTTRAIPKFRLISGELQKDGTSYFDVCLLPDNLTLENLSLISTPSKIILVDFNSESFANGEWLLDMDGFIEIYSVSRIPKGQVQLTNKITNIKCDISDVKALGKVVAELDFKY